MTFAKKILKRQNFSFSLMGLPFEISFDKRLCEFATASGISNEAGDIVLDPSLRDDVLLDTACHELIEVVKQRMEWELPHPIIQQLGVLFGQVLEFSG